MNIKNNRFVSILLIFIIVALIATGIFLGYKITTTPEGQSITLFPNVETNSNSFSDSLKDNPELSIFYNLVVSADQVGFFDSNELTVFVPNNTTLLALGQDNLDQLEDPNNIRILFSYVRSFAVHKLVYSEDLKEGLKLDSLSGGNILIEDKDGVKTIQVNGESGFKAVIGEEISTENGVVYVLSKVE